MKEEFTHLLITAYQYHIFLRINSSLPSPFREIVGDTFQLHTDIFICYQSWTNLLLRARFLGRVILFARPIGHVEKMDAQN